MDKDQLQSDTSVVRVVDVVVVVVVQKLPVPYIVSVPLLRVLSESWSIVDSCRANLVGGFVDVVRR